jgi:hypothetical protein
MASAKSWLCIADKSVGFDESWKNVAAYDIFNLNQNSHQASLIL